jgi:taurine dioxygenase
MDPNYRLVVFKRPSSSDADVREIGMSRVIVSPLMTSIAARIQGVDLRQPIDASVAAQLRNALAEHSVLVFSDQHVDLDQQKRLAQVWGPLEPLPPLKFLGIDEATVSLEPQTPKAVTAEREEHSRGQLSIDIRKVTLDAGIRSEFQGWHTDSSFTTELPHAAVLRAEIIPPVGGGTSWAMMSAAYDALSPRLQEWLETLTAVHTVPPGWRESVGVHNYPKEIQEAFEAQYALTRHPVVVRHPISGRKQLFVNPTYTVSIDDLNPRESVTLLRFLFEHVARADFVYRHRWALGDVVVWDELATLHLAPDDFAPHPRRVVRVTAGLISPMPVNESPAKEREAVLS